MMNARKHSRKRIRPELSDALIPMHHRQPRHRCAKARDADDDRSAGDVSIKRALKSNSKEYNFERVHWLKGSRIRGSMNRGLRGQISPSPLPARVPVRWFHFFNLPQMPKDDRKRAERDRSAEARRYPHMPGLQLARIILSRRQEPN
jgi:hypothetical protein